MESRGSVGTNNDASDATKRIVVRVLETFFRRPVLYLLPLLLLLVLGVISVSNTQREFRAVGTLSASSETVLSQVAGVGTSAFSFETPASITSRKINELLRTREFVERVGAAAEVGSPGAQDELLLAAIRGAVGASADGDNLVRVAATTQDGQTSFDLVQATITSYIEGEIEKRLTETNEAVAFFDEQVTEAQAAVDAARDQRRAYIEENDPNLPADERPPLQSLDIDRLTGLVDRAEQQLTLALDKREEAALAARTAERQIRQQLELVDPPEVPPGAEPRVRKAIMGVAIYVVLGLLISATMLAVATLLDHSIRMPTDLSSRFGVDVLAVVPGGSR